MTNNIKNKAARRVKSKIAANKIDIFELYLGQK
jgi:hypothetical protein